MVKKGLRRSWSPARQARNLIVCRYGRTVREGSIPSSSRILTLHCLSNETHLRHVIWNPRSPHLDYNPKQVKIRCYADCVLTQGNVAVSVVRYIDLSSHRGQVISSLISKIPASKASYSLRVRETVPMQFPSLHKTLHVPVFVTFTIKNGDLSDIELAKRTGGWRLP